MDAVKEEKVEEQENAEVESEEMSAEDIENLSDENLDKHNDGDLEVEAPEVESSESDKGAAEPPEKEKAASEEAKTEVAESTTEGAEVPEKEGEEAEPSKGELKTVTPEDHEKLQLHSEQQAKYIQDRGNEIGDLRAENSKLRKEIIASTPQTLSEEERQRIDEMFLESPTKAQEEQNRILADRKASVEAKQVAEINDTRSLSNDYLERNVPGWTDKKAELAKYMGEVVGDKEFARGYLADPYSDKASGFSIQVMTDVLKAREGEATANAKVKELEGKLKAVQDNLAGIGKRKKSLGNVASLTPEVVAEDGELSDAQIEALSDKQLEAYNAKK